METQRWVNQAQPQTLYIAVILLYLDAGLAVLFGRVGSIFTLALVAGAVAAGFGIANERKWGYWLGIAIAAFGLYPYLLVAATGHLGLLFDPRVLIGLAFAIAKFALLAHPMSRDYYKIWFK